MFFKKPEALRQRVKITTGKFAGQCGRICKVQACGCWVLLDREVLIDGAPVKKVSLMFDCVTPEPGQVIHD